MLPKKKIGHFKLQKHLENLKDWLLTILPELVLYFEAISISSSITHTHTHTQMICLRAIKVNARALENIVSVP
jgi:hypothetical protein